MGGLAAMLIAASVGCSREASNGAPAATTPVVAPDSFEVTLATTKGDVVVRVHRDWAPRGADRLYALVTRGFYDDTRFFRVLWGWSWSTSDRPCVIQSPRCSRRTRAGADRVALVRSVAQKVRPPRALAVPFRFGAPLGEANDAGGQLAVMRAAMDLLSDTGLPPSCATTALSRVFGPTRH